MPAVSDAVICGAGIAGLSTGIMLARAGVRPSIVEIDPGVAVEGTGLTISAVGMRAIRDLGLAEAVNAHGAGYSEMVIGDAAGVELERVPYPAIAGHELPAAGGILRADFHRLLANVAEAEGVTIRYGAGITGFEQGPDSVTVRLSDGGALRTELLVGADGLRSRVRAMAFPGAPEPRYTGQRVWRVRIERPAPGQDHGMWYGPICKAGITPISAVEAYLFVVENSLDAGRPPREEWVQRLRHQLAAFEGVVGWVRDTQLGELSRIDCRPLYAVLVPLPWHRGRVLLVGDALHATTPHLASGAAIAIEDAVVLADLLAEEAELETALRRFGQLRFERCRIVVESSLQLGEWEKRPGAGDADPAGLIASSMAQLARPYRKERSDAPEAAVPARARRDPEPPAPADG